jgi:hypothetical protein
MLQRSLIAQDQSGDRRIWKTKWQPPDERINEKN